MFNSQCEIYLRGISMQNVFYDKSNQETFIFMLSPYEICVCYYFLTLGINNPEGF